MAGDPGKLYGLAEASGIPEFAKQLLDKFFSLRGSVAIFLASVVLLCLKPFAPKELLTWIQGWIAWVYVSGIFSAVFCLTYIYEAGHKKLLQWRSNRRIREREIYRLQNLNSHEKRILRRFVGDGSRAVLLSPMNGHVGMLVRDGLLFQVPGATGRIDELPYGIKDRVIEYLSSHPDLLS